MKELILLALKFISADSQDMRSPDNQDLLCANIPRLRVAVAAVGHCQGGRSLPVPGEGFKAGLQAGSLKRIICTFISLVQHTARGFFKDSFESPWMVSSFGTA